MRGPSQRLASRWETICIGSRWRAKPVLIGMDTRESGPEIAAWLADRVAQTGVAVEFAGVVTTPGIAYLTRTGSSARA